MLENPVLDKTGLTGRYNFKLEWALDGPYRGFELAGPVDVSLFAALQDQLGLELDATKSPVDVLIVEHAEKPSDN